MWRNREPFRLNFPEASTTCSPRAARPHAIVVFVDCWTSFGGSQFLDPPGTGRYLDYLCDEVVAFVDERYRTIASRDHRGIQGKSSGGHGAMVTSMLRPDVFGAFASHAGDALFEACYVKAFADVVRALRDEHDGSYERFWEDFRSRVPMTKQSDGELVETYGYAAACSADDDGTVRAIWLDAGRRDEWYLDNGAVAVSKELEAIGVTHTLELFDAGHISIGYRYPKALGFLAGNLTGAA